MLRHVASYGHIPTTSHLYRWPAGEQGHGNRQSRIRAPDDPRARPLRRRSRISEGSEHAKVDGHRTTWRRRFCAKRSRWRYSHSSYGGSSVLSEADRTRHYYIRRSGRDRDRKRASVQRSCAESLQQQTATSEVLKVISSSPGELEPVFRDDAGERYQSVRTKFGNMYLRRGDAFELAATHNTPPDFAEERKRTPYRLDRGKSPTNQMVRTKSVIHVADLRLRGSYARAIRERLRRRAWRDS